MNKHEWQLSADTGIKYDLEFNKTWYQAVRDFWKRFKRSK